MKINKRTYVISILVVFLLCSASESFAGKKPEKKSSAEQSKVADAGSFGIYVDGRRVATETFRIEQAEALSVISSEFKTDSGEKVHQTSELRIASNGELRRYAWSEKSPGKGQIVVETSGGFLVENITPDPPEKPQSITLILTPAAAVLDDYVFSHREVLLWRYMAQACGSTITSECTLPRTQFGVLVPRQHTSAIVVAEYKGKEKVQIKGTERKLDHFNLIFEGEEWICYLDENMKLVEIIIPTERTEVIRD